MIRPFFVGFFKEIFFTAVFSIYCLTAHALDDITLQLGNIQGEGWQIEGVKLQWQWRTDGKILAMLKVAKVHLPTLKQPLTDLHFQCPQAEYNPELVNCQKASFQLGNNLLDKPVELSFRYNAKTSLISLNIKKLAVANGYLSLQAESSSTGWKAQLKANQVILDKLLNQFTSLVDFTLPVKLAGNVNLSLDISSNQRGQTARLEGQWQEGSFSNQEGTQAAEKLAANLTLTASTDTQQNMQLKGVLAVNHGEVLINPIYVEITDKPVHLSVEMAWKAPLLNIAHFSYNHADILNFEGFTELALGEKFAINNLIIDLKRTDLGLLYAHYLRTWLGEDTTNQINLSGTVDGRLDWQQDRNQLAVNLTNISVEDTKRGLSLNELGGVMRWDSHAPDLPTDLHWSSAYIASKIRLGESQLKANLGGDVIKLLAPWRQPILDGALHIEQLQIHNPGKADMQLEVQGQLQPISLSALSAALGLPPLQGKVSAVIPGIHYQNEQLQLEGTLLLHIFDGDVVVHNLSVEKPLSNVPILSAEIDVNKLNLQTLTDITDFGEIQGHLSGYVHGLRLVNWQPVEFDAFFSTPEDNALPRKINQKAVDNLSNLGGGNAAVNLISRGILGIFDNFSYERIGWGCQLQNGICTMRGAAPAPTGYYIVKGGGLPRIDVIGYNQRVDWAVLLNRLKGLAHMQAPVIE